MVGSENKPGLTEESVISAYRYLLGRAPSDKEVATWMDRPMTLKQLRESFLRSKEFGHIYQSTTGFSRWSPPLGQVLINIRIPKTAGTSLTSIIAQSFPTDAVLYTDDRDLSNVTGLGAGERLKVGMVAGHIRYGLGALFPQRTLYVTMLREPIERIYSFYRYVRRTTDHPLNGLFTAHDLTFGMFLERGLKNYSVRCEVDNGQVRRLAGDMTEASFADTALLYRQAMHNLFAPNMLFGIASNFEGLLRRLVAEGIIREAKQLYANTSPDDELPLEDAIAEMTDHQLELLRYFTFWDDLLYNSASAFAVTD